MRRAAASLILLAALLWAAAGTARPAAPPQPQLRAAEPWLTLAAQPRFTLWLTSSRELCTAGTLTEISWNISDGSAPYHLTIEGEPVDPNADNVRINCGPLTETEAADEQTALAAKTITATVTDSRGVRREAALDVARVRALAPPNPRTPSAQRTLIATDWVMSDNGRREASASWWLMRWRAATDSSWAYKRVWGGKHDIVGGSLDGLNEGSSYVLAVATLRDPIEQLTPDALPWSRQLEAKTTTTPTGVQAVSTHDTITVTWNDQPSANIYVDIVRADGAGRTAASAIGYDANPPNQTTFIDLEPETQYIIGVEANGDNEQVLKTSITIATTATPSDWSPPSRGAQNLSVTATHDTITVTWDAPVPNTRDRWVVYVEHPSWYSAYNRWVSAPLAVALGPFTPETTYTVSVVHLDLYGVEVSTTVTTAAAPAARVRSHTR